MRLTEWESEANHRQRQRWLVSTFVVGMCVASSVLASQLWRQPSPPPGPPSVAMVVSVAQLPAAPQPQAATEHTPAPERSTLREPAMPPPKPMPMPKPKPKPKPESKPRPLPKSETELPPSPIAIPKAKPEPGPEPKSEHEPKPEPEPQPKPEAELAPAPEPEPEPAPQRKPELRPKAVVKPSPREPARTAPATTPSQTTTTATRQQSRPSGTGTIADTPPSYRQQLRAWLARHKTYPRRARRLKQEGTVVLYFVMAHDGSVLTWDIRKSSGHDLLDEAVKQLIRSASPMPALPPEVTMDRLALTVPIRFRLQ